MLAAPETVPPALRELSARRRADGGGAAPTDWPCVRRGVSTASSMRPGLTGD